MSKMAVLTGVLAAGVLLAGCTLNLPAVNIPPPTVPASSATTASATASATPSLTPTLPQPTSTATTPPAPVGPPIEKLQAGLEITIASGRAVQPLPEGDRYLGFLFARAGTPDEVDGALRAAHSQLAIVIAGVGSMG